MGFLFEILFNIGKEKKVNYLENPTYFHVHEIMRYAWRKHNLSFWKETNKTNELDMAKFSLKVYLY